MTMRLCELLADGEKRLRQAGIEEYKNDAWLLWEYSSGMSRTVYLMNMREELDFIDKDGAWRRDYEQAVRKRCTHIPLQHITKKQCFCGLDFFVNEHVLVPRQDTEVLVDQLLKKIEGMENKDEKIKILDMCTGSGCIAISTKCLAKKPVDMTAADLSPEALIVAERNRKTHGCEICFIQGDLFENVPNEQGGQFHIIVSNPPYIKRDVISSLAEEVKLHEPLMALDGDKDGLKFYRAITKGAVRYLREEGVLLYEIGYDQAEDVSEILKQNGFCEIQVIKDFAGLDRVITAKRGKM